MCLNDTGSTAGSELLPDILVRLTYASLNPSNNPVTGVSNTHNWDITLVNGQYSGNTTIWGETSTIEASFPPASNNYLHNLTYISSSVYKPFIKDVVVSYQDGTSGIYSRNTTISGKVVDIYGRPIIDGTVSITIGGDVYLLNSSQFDGENFTLTIVNNFTGVKNVVIYYNNTGAHLRAEAYAFTEVIVNKATTNSTIGTNISVVKVDRNVTISGVLVDEFGVPIGGVMLTVVVEGQTYNPVTDVNGVWSVNHTAIAVGNGVVVSVSWAGDLNHTGFTNSTTFDVTKRELSSTLTIIKNSDGSVKLVINLTDINGNPVQNHPVKVFVNGKYITTVITNANGIGVVMLPARVLSHKNKISILAGNEYYEDYTNFIEFVMPNNETNNDNETTEEISHNAYMKPTGIPLIAILLVLLSTIGLLTRKKRK